MVCGATAMTKPLHGSKDRTVKHETIDRSVHYFLIRKG